MKKVIYAVMLICFGTVTQAQDALYTKVISVLKSELPNLVTNDKLVAVNIWRVSDAKSRNANKEFNKAAGVYESARLKGGLKGVIAVAISADDNENEVIIALNKDVSNSKIIRLSKKDFTEGLPGTGNFVFASNGSMVYSNLEPGEIVESIHQLITR